MRLRSGSSTPARAPRKRVARVDADEAHAEVLAELALDLGALALPQQAVVDEDAGQPLAERPVHEGGGHRGIDTPGEPAHDAPVAHLRCAPRRPPRR